MQEGFKKSKSAAGVLDRISLHFLLFGFRLRLKCFMACVVAKLRCLSPDLKYFMRISGGSGNAVEPA